MNFESPVLTELVEQIIFSIENEKAKWEIEKGSTKHYHMWNSDDAIYMYFHLDWPARVSIYSEMTLLQLPRSLKKRLITWGKNYIKRNVEQDITDRNITYAGKALTRLGGKIPSDAPPGQVHPGDGFVQSSVLP